MTLRGTALRRHVHTVELGAVEAAKITMRTGTRPTGPMAEFVYLTRATTAVSDLHGIVSYIQTMEGKP